MGRTGPSPASGCGCWPRAAGRGSRRCSCRRACRPTASAPRPISFALAPRINALGRVGHALDAALLLLEDDPERIAELVARIEAANLERRGLMTAALAEAREALGPMTGRPSPSWPGPGRRASWGSWPAASRTSWDVRRSCSRPPSTPGGAPRAAPAASTWVPRSRPTRRCSSDTAVMRRQPAAISTLPGTTTSGPRCWPASRTRRRCAIPAGHWCSTSSRAQVPWITYSSPS